MIAAAGALAMILLGADGAAAPDPLESLPRTGGEVLVGGLAGPVTIRRDARGIPVVRGVRLDDVIRAQGFLHGQERLFQMDLMRRLAAGRLAELLGPSAAPGDEHYRRLRFDAVVEEAMELAPDDLRRLLEVYAEGVNAGIADLGAPPPEYGLLEVEPVEWAMGDTLLVTFAMFDMLNFSATLERPLETMRAALPRELADFLAAEDTRFESPLLARGAPAADGAAAPRPVPGADVVDLRGRRAARGHADLVEVAPPVLGSNNWAVAGHRTADGRAILANDPHLRITAPGIWYRAELEWGEHRVAGLSLPGSPGILIGSNTHLAWGFTNTQADFQDLVVVEVDPDDPSRYRTPDGHEPFGEVVEEIRVRGAAPRRLVLRTTRWGVVTGSDRQGRPLVLKWTALEPRTVNMNVLRFGTARTLEEGVDIARAWYGPSQNVLLADAGGRIAWVVSGYFPRRVGLDGTVPVSWADDGVGWDGPLEEARRPVLVDPEEGLLYTANNRTVPLAWARDLGQGWDLGARAQRIGTLLRSKEQVTERDLALMQLDTRVEFYDFYRDLVLEVTAGAAAGTPAAEARRIVAAWDGTAGADQPGMRILNAYRRGLYRAVAAPLVAPCRELDPAFRFRWSRGEEPIRRILETRPPHLLPPGAADWPAFLRGTLDTTLAALVVRAPAGGLAWPWGGDNRALVHHPIADAAPTHADMLNMPDAPLSGHPYAVRVATPSFGASARLVVSPGREREGLLHIPAGQSGHPFSPHYRDGHADWLEGRATPFLAGRGVSEIVLRPAR